jgi:hypothetical protein
MDFSAGTDFQDLAEARIIVPRNKREYVRTPRIGMGSRSPKNDCFDGYEDTVGVKADSFKIENKWKRKRAVYSKQTDLGIDLGIRKTENTSMTQYRNELLFSYRNPDFIRDLNQFFKVKNKELRKSLLGKYHNRCQTAFADDSSSLYDRTYRKLTTNIKFMKKELLPQTKAGFSLKSDSPTVGLKIKGILKEFSIRKPCKV